jgi:hypothetical protein
MAQPVFADRVILPPNSSGTPTGWFAAAVAGGTLYLPGTVLTDAAGNSIDAATATPAGTERGLITRPIFPLATGRIDVNIGALAAGLSLPIVGSAPTPSTATWTSATTLNTALAYTGLGPYGACTIQIVVPSTVTAGAITIESSADGTNWQQAGSVRVDNSAAENVVPLAYWPGTNGTRQYLVSLDGLTQIRLRLSTVIAGTGNVSVLIAPAQQAAEPLVAQRSRKVPTYKAVFRNAARPFPLSFAFTANTRKQFATIHHAAASTKTVRLRSVKVFMNDTTVAGVIQIDLVRITTAPATGAPAITPAAADGADPAAEATCLALPGTAATESAAIYSTVRYNPSATAAQATPYPQISAPWVEMLDASALDDERKAPVIRAGVLEGWAVTLDVNVATTTTAMVQIEFTEEPA